MKVPLLDLKAQYNSIRRDIEAAMTEVVESQMFILGPQVKACEAAIAAYSRCAFGVGVSSGTDALLIALMAEQVGPGDEVITSPYTFFASAGSIARLGAKTVFVDIDPITYNINPALIERAVTPRTKAIMPVYLYGQMADMNAVMAVARKHKLAVVEDACQSIGAEHQGQRAGAVGDYGCFSFFPSKNLGCFGDGGMVITQDPERAERLNVLRVHGSKPKYYHHVLGGNFRFDTLQAAVILAKLPYLDRWSDRRRSNADRYTRLFNACGLPAKNAVQLPVMRIDRHVFNQYVIRAPRRDELIAWLRKHDVGCEIYYPLPLHLQTCFAGLGYRAGDFPESEKAAAETVALPIYPELTDEQAEHVVKTVEAFYRQ